MTGLTAPIHVNVNGCPTTRLKFEFVIVILAIDSGIIRNRFTKIIEGRGAIMLRSVALAFTRPIEHRGKRGSFTDLQLAVYFFERAVRAKICPIPMLLGG